MPRSQCHVAEFKQLLDSFIASKKSFQVIRSIPSKQAPSLPNVHPKTLFVLDSSFNPPSLAHSSMAETAAAYSKTKYSLPHRILLLFSVHNADKSPAPAAFEHRLALMALMAEDLHLKWNETKSGAAMNSSDSGARSVANSSFPTIDLALTTQPFYVDKSSAIIESETYPRDCKHVHLVGYDTMVRIFDTKYYKSFSPPFSALSDFFKNHGFLVTLRPGNEWGDEESQWQLWCDLKTGRLEKQGAKPSWADKVTMVPADSEGTGVSSTLIREALEKEDYTAVDKLCSKGVARWIREHGLYQGR